jgi:hypothetical protein
MAKTRIHRLIQQWRQNQTTDELVASIIWTLVYYSYCGIREIGDYEKQKNKTKRLFQTCLIQKNKKVKYLFVHYQKNDLLDFQTKRMTQHKKHYRILSTVCQYPSKKDAGQYVGYLDEGFRHYFESAYSRDEIAQCFRNNWLYWACKTPVWNQRLFQHGGKINILTETVEFSKEEEEESFYKTYGYEPDEQPKKVFDYCVSA